MNSLKTPILLLESPCSLVGPSVRDKISAKFQHTISRQRKELPEIRWCQNDRIFEGFLDFPKNMKFWISGFLDFWIFGFLDFLDFRLYLGNKKRYRKSAGVKTAGFSRAFWIFQKYEIMDFWNSGFLDFWILWIFMDFRLYLGNEKSYWKSAGVKTTGFSRLFGFSKKY